jgi:hypothetical protein
MIFQGDNYNDKLFGVAFLPFFSIVFFWSAFSPDITITGRIVAVIIGLFILIFSILYFTYGRYKVRCEENQIVKIHTSSRIPIKYYSYQDLNLLKFVNPLKGSKRVFFYFLDKHKKETKFDIDFDNLNEIIPLIIHCKKMNTNTKIEVKSYDDKMRKFIIRELKKETCEFIIY